VATDRLKIYNGALLICKERSLASLTENREPRRLLDDVWNDGGVRYCLEQGQWAFAIRASQLDYTPSVAPTWGFRRAFTKPSDWIDTSAVCSDPYFKAPLLEYADEVGYWFCDIDQIYVKYVSDDNNYGNNLANWPVSFTEYVKTHFAGKIVHKVTQDEKLIDRITHPKHGLEAVARLNAKNRDAMGRPTTFPSRGRWASARYGRNAGYRDQGNPSSLIG
jgi:hypothetical protein